MCIAAILTMIATHALVVESLHGTIVTVCFRGVHGMYASSLKELFSIQPLCFDLFMMFACQVYDLLRIICLTTCRVQAYNQAYTV